MKILAVLMILIGLVMCWGAVQEFFYYTPEASPFWVGVFATPASLLFAVAGALLWFRGRSIGRMVLLAGIVMASATIAGTALGVMGRPATILGMVGSLAAIGWSWRTGAVTV